MVKQRSIPDRGGPDLHSLPLPGDAGRGGRDDIVAVCDAKGRIVHGALAGGFDPDAAELMLLSGESLTPLRLPVDDVRWVLLERHPLDGWSAEWPLQRLMLCLEGGQVVRTLLGAPPRRGGRAVVVTLVDISRDCVETVAIPQVALQAMVPLPGAEDRLAGDAAAASEPPLMRLLHQMRELRRLHSGGVIDDAEFARRRRLVLERI